MPISDICTVGEIEGKMGERIMNAAKKFEELIEEVKNMDPFYQTRLLYVFLGSLSTRLEKPTINKSDIVTSLDLSLEYFKKNKAKGGL